MEVIRRGALLSLFSLMLLDSKRRLMESNSSLSLEVSCTYMSVVMKFTPSRDICKYTYCEGVN